jgi:hypothetical protein
VRLDHKKFFREERGEVRFAPALHRLRSIEVHQSSLRQLKTSCTVFGGYSVGVTPVPIPNTEVKPYSADDTAWVTMWESRSPPKFIRNGPPLLEAGLAFP